MVCVWSLLTWLCASCLALTQRWELELEMPDGSNHPVQLMIDDQRDLKLQVNQFCKAHGVEAAGCARLLAGVARRTEQVASGRALHWDPLFVNERIALPHSGAEVKSPCCVSVHRLLELMQRMEYRKIHLLGLDGYTNAYFFEESARYEAVASEYLSYRNRNREPVPGSTPHPVAFEMRYEGRRDTPDERSTYRLLFTGVFAEFAAYNGIELVNLAPKSTLQRFVKTRTLSSVLGEMRELDGVAERCVQAMDLDGVLNNEDSTLVTPSLCDKVYAEIKRQLDR